MMLRILATCLLAVGLLGVSTPQANQCLSRADVYAQVTAGNLTWKSSAPSGWSTDHTMVTWTDFTNNIANGGSCIQPAGTPNGLMSWSQMISSGCATNHVVSQQSQTFSGSYSTIYYTSTFNTRLQEYSCAGPYGSDAYAGNTVTLPAGTVAPTSASTELSLTISSVNYSGSTGLTVSLYTPSGGLVETGFNAGAPPYYAAGAPSGAWYWVISQQGGTDGTCNSTSGASGGGLQASWSGTATFYE